MIHSTGWYISSGSWVGLTLIYAGHDHNSEVNFLRPYGRVIDYNRLWVSQEDLALQMEL